MADFCNELPELNREAEFVALLVRCEPQLAACVHTMVPVWQDAEEVLQETRMMLWRQFDRFRPGSDFWPGRVLWRTSRRGPLCRLATSTTSIQRRPDDTLVAQLAATPEDANRRWAAFLECGKKLGTAARKILRLVYVENRKIKDVAEQLGRSPDGAYVTLSRIRRGLIDCMEQRLGQEEDR